MLNNPRPLLQIKDLVTEFKTSHGMVRAVDHVSYSINPSETVGLVGESGCGKSVTGLSIMRLVATPPGKITGGSIEFDGRDLLQLSIREMREIRGARISMIFQEPMTSLNPVYTVGDQIGEVLRLHQKMSASQAREATLELLKLVGIPEPASRFDNYPHQLSGGMRQRIMIAMGLACKPALLIADEPTTALDVTIQAQILDLLKRLQEQYKMAVLLISHNLGVIAEMAHRVVVMYAGRIVESATVGELYDNPLHPYTKALYASLPSVQRQHGSKRLVTIPGSVPRLGELPSGCKFRNRCPLATNECVLTEPELRELTPGHWVRCIYAGK